MEILSRREKLPLAVDLDNCTVYIVSLQGNDCFFFNYIEKMPASVSYMKLYIQHKTILQKWKKLYFTQK